MTRHAFVLGAGLGTRLLPLTAQCPKPLIPVANRPLIAYAFDHLIEAGVETFIVNTHWRAEAYARAFPDASYRGRPITFRHESPEVLETAGGLKNSAELLQHAPFWVYNGDILSNLPLAPALRAHQATGNEVTLVLRSHGGPLQVAFEKKTGRISDLGNRLDPTSDTRFLFTGIYLVEPRFLARIPTATKISVVPIFCEMIRTGAPLGGVIIDEGDWWDLGTREEYLAVHAALAGRALGSRRPPWIDPAARIGRGAEIRGASAVGAGAEIGDGAQLTNSIVWHGAKVAAGAVLERCIVASGACAAGTLHDLDIV